MGEDVPFIQICEGRFINFFSKNITFTINMHLTSDKTSFHKIYNSGEGIIAED